MNEYCDNGQCPAQARVTVFTPAAGRGRIVSMTV
jgi:hypothetical protein